MQERKPRVDVQRNRAAPLGAAQRHFLRYGVGTPLEAVAKEAGVGPGTLYRHFPNREALLAAVLQTRSKSCYIEDFAAFGTTTIGQVTNPDVLSDPAWQKAYRASLLDTKKPGAPAYLYHGTADTIVPIAQRDLLYHDWCIQGASVQYEVLPGLEHVSGFVAGAPAGIQWLADRLAGKQAVAGCHEVGLP